MQAGRSRGLHSGVHKPKARQQTINQSGTDAPGIRHNRAPCTNCKFRTARERLRSRENFGAYVASEIDDRPSLASLGGWIASASWSLPE